jgi:hypothetical protein
MIRPVPTNQATPLATEIAGFCNKIGTPQPVSKRFGIGTEKVCVVARFWIIQKAKLWQIQKLRSKPYQIQKIGRALARLFVETEIGFGCTFAP